MFIVTVRLPSCFPFADNELFADPDDAVERAYEWLKWGGATDCEVMDEGEWLNRLARDTFTAVGLGAVFGYEVATLNTEERKAA